jgi:Na+-transporting NADH:ubiquinone oxidoreductase subunit NqrA
MLSWCLIESLKDVWLMEIVVISEDLILTIANHFLFSTEQMVHSHVVAITNSESPDSRYVRTHAKDIIRNWIDLKIVVVQSTYHVWKNWVELFDFLILFGFLITY